MIRGLALLFFSLLFSFALGAIVEFDYDTHNTPALYLWSTGGTWKGGSAPTSSDDVVIMGCAQCIGSLDLGGVLIDIPADISVNSLTVGGRDIVLRLNGGLTIGNLTYQGGGIISASADQYSISTTTAFFGYDVTNFCYIMSISFVNSGSLTFGTFCTFLKTSFVNTGDWVWQFPNSGEISTGATPPVISGNTLSNSGNMRFSYSGQNAPADVSLFLQMENSGTFTIDSTVLLHVGDDDLIEAQVFNNTGIISIAADGIFEINNMATVNLNPGTQLSGTGTIQLIVASLGDSATLAQYTNLNFAGVFHMDGWVTFIGNSYTFQVATLEILIGSTLTGSGLITATSATIANAINALTTNTIELQRSITVSNSLNVSFSVSWTLYISNNAVITVNSGALATFGFGIIDSHDYTSSIVINGNLTHTTYPIGFMAVYIPVIFNGAISIPYYPPDAFEGSALSFLGGGDLKGIIDTPALRFDETATSNAGLTFAQYRVYSSTGFSGLFKLGNWDPTCVNVYDNGGLCKFTGAFVITQATTIPTIYLDNNANIFVNSSNVKIVDFLASGGGISGSASSFVITNFQMIGGTVTQIIDSINVQIENNITLDNFFINLQNGGSITILPSATAELVYDLNLPPLTPDNGYILNQGTFRVHMLTYATRTIYKNFTNAGQIVFVDTPAVLEIGENAIFSQTSSGSIALSVYSASSMDSLRYFPGDHCSFSGILKIDFQFTATTSFSYPILEYQNSQACSGAFALQVTGLASNLKANIFYDYPRDGFAAINAFLVVCDSSNTTCTSYIRPGTTPPPTPVPTTTGGGITPAPQPTTTTSASASSSSTGKTSSSSSPSSTTSASSSPSSTTSEPSSAFSLCASTFLFLSFAFFVL